MSGYMERNLIPGKTHENDDECIYELVGITFHTGTAKGGNYYSFIRNRNNQQWFLFNDSEVKPFDAASQLAVRERLSR